jgi:DNA (cytosine-5)-methyltransferase 1
MKIPKPETIRAARHKAGLSQTAAAQLIWSHLRSWQDWESGNRRMMPAVWFAFLVRAKMFKTRT